MLPVLNLHAEGLSHQLLSNFCCLFSKPLLGQRPDLPQHALLLAHPTFEELEAVN